ncbi:benzoate/H(+) symporter BenE family transporter [Halomonas cupida]|uniref:Benzoate membrane transport protein n=2 Tax=Halomonas cupida TaxID=44933 RepID=A0A1M7E3L1_9GAMM|nr:benzoate/H(+) symporter BenE family transporter [Halomonas cupida]SHL86345.1 benzoate membrane transport protein [Halomonas cupida]
MTHPTSSSKPVGLLPSLRHDFSLSAIVAGFVAVLISYSGPLAIFFQAGEAAQVPAAMMTSWVWAISMGAALSGIVLSLWLRVPVVTAWSAPGTALLVTLFPGMSLNEAVGAYITAAVLLLVIGLSGSFDRLMALIPKGIAAGMMAGILFQFGLGAFQSIQTSPALALGMLAAYLLFKRVWPRYCLILLLMTGVVLAVLLEGASLEGVALHVAIPQWISPEWNLASTLSLAVPLLVVSLTGQFLPGMAILHGAGYSTSARPILTVSALTSLATACAGGIMTVVAAITAAICTGRDAHENPDRRYIAGVANGVFYLIGGLFAGTIVALFTSLPGAFVAVLAGLALIGAIMSNLAAVIEAEDHREASVITFMVTASGMSLFGLGAAFWGVVIGAVAVKVLHGQGGWLGRLRRS